MQLAVFVCVICAICERIFTQEDSIYIAHRNPISLSQISLIIADKTTKPTTALTIPTCLSLRNNAACCIPLRNLRNLRENNTQEDSINLHKRNPRSLPQISLIYADKQQNIKTTNHNNHTNPRAHAHRVFQKYQCRSVYTLTIRMLHILFSLFNCHHCVVCRNVISASLSPCQLELVSRQNMTYTHDVAVVDADVAILILHPLHNLRCCESQ